MYSLIFWNRFCSLVCRQGTSVAHSEHNFLLSIQCFNLIITLLYLHMLSCPFHYECLSAIHWMLWLTIQNGFFFPFSFPWICVLLETYWMQAFLNTHRNVSSILYYISNFMLIFGTFPHFGYVFITFIFILMIIVKIKRIWQFFPCLFFIYPNLSLPQLRTRDAHIGVWGFWLGLGIETKISANIIQNTECQHVCCYVQINYLQKHLELTVVFLSIWCDRL